MSQTTPPQEPSQPPATWRAVLLRPDGSAELLALPAPTRSYLPMLVVMGRALNDPASAATGVEPVRLAADLTAWVGEYSLIDGTEQNPPATYLMWHLRTLAGGQVGYPLCGPVIFTGGLHGQDESELPTRWHNHFTPALRR